ncbi:MAG TPA: hypothetical protein VM513_00150 [Kofleriaceae bacterium]|jgi:hypothetical protein|nr:hypothetical protein [Kofleriaceae bacterium]
MSARYEIDRNDLKVVAAFVGAAVVLLCVAFYFLSQAYYDDRAKDGYLVSEGRIDNVRIAFTVFVVLVGKAAILASLSPRIVGHALSAIAGLGAIVGGVATATAGVNVVLPITLFIGGALFLVLTWQSLERSRPAWAFLIAMCSVFGVVMLFGATKVRNHTGVGLYYALIVPGLLQVATVALALLRREYRERT